jgi:flavin-dependent dehydrogenase
MTCGYFAGGVCRAVGALESPLGRDYARLGKVFDAIVIGAGPAGCVAAKLLASWGHRILLLGRDSKPANLAESLPPSAATIVQLTGTQEAVRRAALSHCLGNVAWWGAGEPRTETYPESSPGTHLLRATLDRELRNSVRELFTQAQVTSVERTASGFEVRTSTNVFRSPYLLDCSGRAGVAARRGYRLRNEALRTIAHAAVWKAPRPLPLDPAYTMVEAYRDGWAWAIPLSSTDIYIGVLVDTQRTERASGMVRRTMYCAEIEKTVAFRQLVSGSELGEISSCDASCYAAARYAEDGLFLAGDAASAVDPISSFGVKKALTSAWLAAVCIHTGLADPARKSLASEYYHEQTRQSHEDLCRHAQQHFSVIAARQPHPFWAARAALEPLQLYEPAALLAELRRLREPSRIALEPTARVRRGVRVKVSGNEVVSEDGWVTDALPPGMEFACGVELMKLVDLADKFSQVPDLHQAYNSAAEPVDFPNFLGALCLLLASGVLRHR